MKTINSPIRLISLGVAIPTTDIIFSLIFGRYIIGEISIGMAAILFIFGYSKLLEAEKEAIKKIESKGESE